MITTKKYKEIVSDLKDQIKCNAVNSKTIKKHRKPYEQARTKAFDAYWNGNENYSLLNKSCKEAYDTFKSACMIDAFSSEEATALHILYNRIRGNGECRPEHTKNDQAYLKETINGTLYYDRWKKYLLDTHGVDCREIEYLSSAASSKPHYEEIAIELMNPLMEKVNE